MRILVTGSCGLIGGEAVEYFGTRGHEIVGVDNNSRRRFFGEAGDTLWNLHRVAHKVPSYKHHDSDICNGPVWETNGATNTSVVKTDALSMYVFQGKPYDAVIHCAAQPSHDKATEDPALDRRVNVLGTHNLLEATRKHSPNAVFIFMSTNKVYDDAVNASEFEEFGNRYDRRDWVGFNENTATGAQGIFGRDKLEADELVQSYGKNFGMRTIVLRGGCLTGPGHSGVELHGFLSYLVKCAITDKTYKIFGYGGKQVRDNIHSYDVCCAFEEIIKNPPAPGEVFNIGGGRANSVSVLEAIQKVEHLTGLRMKVEQVVAARSGDHRVYITDLTKLQSRYPNWSITKSLDDTLAEMIQQDYWGKYSDHESTKTYDLNSESVVFDVGGYRGAFSQDIMDRYHPKLYIFEPVREFHDAIRHRFGNRVALYQFGLSDADRKIMIYKQGQNSSVWRGGPGLEQLPPDRVYGAPIAEEIELRDVVQVFRDLHQLGEIDLMSLNCEGGEFEIIPRLIETGQISRVKNLQVQFHRFHPNADALREQLRVALRATHEERFCYPFVWESWRRM